MTGAERVYIIGGTGNVGTAAVKNLLKDQVPVTVYARSSAKVQSLFGSDSNLAVVEGDLSDLKPFERSIAGHTRLFLLVANFADLTKTATTISTIAYGAGVKQIVHITSAGVNLPPRVSFIGDGHRQCEDALVAIPNRGAYVSLRPYKFISNMKTEVYDIKNGAITGIFDPDMPVEWISPNDIGLAAANILQEPVEKHGDIAYEMIGDVITNSQRAAVFSKVLGRKITYKRVTAQEQYNVLIAATGMPHVNVFDIMSLPTLHGIPTPALPVILGREPETVEQWLEKNKDFFL
ncbi:hypothetical protein BJV82DRAFT_601987 [Fennellomyces sp. T-0311]|nr:hypothetical protein BJV82DRAFT_601987 [Fennellomyces sp. T-0311]